MNGAARSGGVVESVEFRARYRLRFAMLPGYRRDPVYGTLFYVKRDMALDTRGVPLVERDGIAQLLLALPDAVAAREE